MAATKLASLAKSSAVMTAGTLVSRILGFVKAMLLATAIGVTVGGAADAFDIANKVPNNLYMLLAGGVLNAVLVPQIVRATRRTDGGRDFTNRLLTLTVTLLFAVTVVATLCAPLLVRLYSTSAWSPEQTALAVAFAYWCLPQIFFYGLYTMLGQVLNAKSSFGPYMWAPVLNNVVSIAGLLVFIAVFGTGQQGEHAVGTWDAGKIALLAGSATLGVMCQALVLIWPLKRIGFTYRPTFGFRGFGLSTAGRVAGWTFAAVLVGQLGYIVTSQVASTASSTTGEPSASNAAYSLAYLMFMLPHSLVAVSLATALFTSLSTYAADDDVDSVRSSLALGTRLVGLVNVFATVAFIALAGPAAMVIGGGSQEQARSIAPVIVTMVIGLVPFSANYLLQRVFYAYEDARTPFWIQVPQVVLTAAGVLAAGFLLPKPLIVAGIGLAMSCGYLLACFLSAVLLRRRIGHLGTGQILLAHAKFAVAGGLSCAAGFGLLRWAGPEAWDGRLPALLTVAWIGLAMLGLYLAVCWVLRVSELRAALETVRRVLKR
ncbi:lipid II flippase MurJ [Brevibacterium daeguense]|uniref:Lipid II flippase MurJ n=1 Tax=Brevibacterium daeguense TaxID=909936 RepID=A0ABP8EEZ4_9MICO